MASRFSRCLSMFRIAFSPSARSGGGDVLHSRVSCVGRSPDPASACGPPDPRSLPCVSSALSKLRSSTVVELLPPCAAGLPGGELGAEEVFRSLYLAVDSLVGATSFGDDSASCPLTDPANSRGGLLASRSSEYVLVWPTLLVTSTEDRNDAGDSPPLLLWVLLSGGG